MTMHTFDGASVAQIGDPDFCCLPKRFTKVLANALCYHRQRNKRDQVGRIGCNVQDPTITPTFEQITKLGVLSQERANIGGGYSYGLNQQFIDKELKEQPQCTVPEPEDTSMYENGEGANAE